MLTALTDEECRRLLAANHLGRLAVTLPSGRPLIRPVNYAFDQATQSVVFRSRAGSKHYALTHAPRACFEIDDGAGGADGAWSVIITGSTEIVSRPSEIERLERSDWRRGTAGKPWLGSHPRQRGLRPATGLTVAAGRAEPALAMPAPQPQRAAAAAPSPPALRL